MKVPRRLRKLLPYVLVLLLAGATVLTTIYYVPRPPVSAEGESPPRRDPGDGFQLERVTIHIDPQENISLSMLLTNNATTPVGVVGWRFHDTGGGGSLLVPDERIIPPGVSNQRLQVPDEVFETYWDLSDEVFQAYWYVDRPRENVTVLTWASYLPLPSLDAILSPEWGSDAIVFRGWFSNGVEVFSAQPGERLEARWHMLFGGGGGLDQLTVTFYREDALGADQGWSREFLLVKATPGEQTAFSIQLSLEEEPTEGPTAYYATLETKNSEGRSPAIPVSLTGGALSQDEPLEAGEPFTELVGGTVPGSVRVAGCRLLMENVVSFDLDVNAVRGALSPGDAPGVLLNGEELPNLYSIDGEVWRYYRGLVSPLVSTAGFGLLPFQRHEFSVEVEIGVPRFRPAETRPSCISEVPTLRFTGFETRITPTTRSTIIGFNGVYEPDQGYLDSFMAVYVGAATLLLALSLAKREGPRTMGARLRLLGGLASGVAAFWLGIGHGSGLLILGWAAVISIDSLSRIVAWEPLHRRIPQFLDWVFLLAPSVLFLSILVEGVPDFYRNGFILWTVVVDGLVVALLYLRRRGLTL